MSETILFLNDRAEDPTKRLKLAGIRRYAAAAGWDVVSIKEELSGKRRIPRLLAAYCPVGCICDEDSIPTGATPRLFGSVPVVFANAYGRSRSADAVCVCVDNAAVARAAFRELSAGNPESFAVVTEATSHEWSAVRVRTFRAEASNAGCPCPVYREIRWTEREESLVALRPWLASLPRHTAIYAVNDPLARRVADAALGAGLRIPQDLTLLGTDNNPACCEASRPTLSSIQLDFERMGYLAARMLAARMTGRAELGMKGRAELGMKGAASAANDGDHSFAPKAHPSFGGAAATLHCGNAAPPFGGAAATLHCGSAAPPFGGAAATLHCGKAAPPFGGAAATLHCGNAAPSLPRPDGNDSVIAIGPWLPVRRESTGGRGRREPHILEAVEIIRREACDGLTVAALAERLPGSRRLLDLRFREAMGHSVLDEIVQVRLERVFDLLRRPEMPIGAIADFSGFALHQLDKVFRARFGCSLREWRKRNVQP